MTLDADQIVDRRRLRRKLSFWRVAAFLLLAVVAIVVIGLLAGRDTFSALAPPVESIATITPLTPSVLARRSKSSVCA